mmetsp:Transcript_182915/g.445315  ORF Transcript_182915/g.445315 Transcript_182915/m.445315 type:complete len:229 (-) Transcript_182915:1107-1793(-)
MDQPSNAASSSSMLPPAMPGHMREPAGVAKSAASSALEVSAEAAARHLAAVSRTVVRVLAAVAKRAAAVQEAPALLPLALSCALAFALVGVEEHCRRSRLFDGKRAQTPQDDGNAALPALLVCRQGIDAMLPADVHISAKEEEHAVRLREVHELACLCVPKSKLTRGTKRHANRAILFTRTLRVERSGVVMKRFPIRPVAVPVEACATVALCDREVIADLVNHPVVCF